MKLITVDFDGTLFEGDSSKLMFQAGKKEFEVKDWLTVLSGTTEAIYYGATEGKQSLRVHFFKAFARTFKGKTESELTAFFRQLVAGSMDKINWSLVEKIKKHQADGDRVIILSGALRPFLEALTESLELDVEVIGSELIYEADRTCTGGTGPVINGEQKVKAVNNWLQTNKLTPVEIWAYADSVSDIPLLELVDQPIIVNPKDGMREIAERNEWPLFGEDFVSLHS